MKYAMAIAAALALMTAVATPARAADDSKVKAATNQVDSGAKKIGAGEISEGVKDTAKGIGKTVEEGAKYTGEKLKEAGRAAEPEAKTAGRSFRDSAVAFGSSVKHFFTRLFGG
jgi:hypothetical protein